MNLNEKLKEIRILRGLTQKDVAKALNISVSTLSEYENGKYDPSLSRLFSLLDFYNIEPFHFIKKGEEVINITNYSEINKKKVYAIDALEKQNRK